MVRSGMVFLLARNLEQRKWISGASARLRVSHALCTGRLEGERTRR
jgi:hypothetical protein